MKAEKNKQQAKSLKTRDKILSATIDCIFEKGLMNTSTHDIYKRAGISRGAMQHHYPTKEALLHAAYKELLETEVGKLRDAASVFNSSGISIDDFIDQMWARFSVESFSITLDYFAVARTDEVLKKNVQKARKQYDEALEDIWMQYFAGQETSEKKLLALLGMTINLFRGMSLQMLVQPDKARLDGMVNELKHQLRESLRVRD